MPKNREALESFVYQSATESNCEGANMASQAGRLSIDSATFTPAVNQKQGLKDSTNQPSKHGSNHSNNGLKMEARESLLEMQNFGEVAPKVSQMIMQGKRKKLSIELTKENASRLSKQPEDGWVSASGVSENNYASARTMVQTTDADCGEESVYTNIYSGKKNTAVELQKEQGRPSLMKGKRQSKADHKNLLSASETEGPDQKYQKQAARRSGRTANSRKEIVDV